MKVPVLLAILFLASAGHAQEMFQERRLPAVDQAYAAWKADWSAQQGGLNSTNWFPWGARAILYNGLHSLLVCHHATAGCMFAQQTSPGVFIDGSPYVIANKTLFPQGDRMARVWDADHDGDLDIFGLSNDENTIPSLMNNNGFFTPVPGFSLFPMTRPHGDRFGYRNEDGVQDQNGDGYLDIVEQATGLEYWWDVGLNKLVKKIPPSATRPVYDAATEQFIATELAKTANQFGHLDWYTGYDINGDGLSDSVFTFWAPGLGSRFARIMIKQANGSYVDETAARGLPLDSYISQIGDVSGDGRLDIAANRGAGGLYIQQPNGTFLLSGHACVDRFLAFANDGYRQNVEFIDFDVDGDRDVLMHMQNFKWLRVCKNNGIAQMTTGLNITPTCGSQPICKNSAGVLWPITPGAEAGWRDPYDLVDICSPDGGGPDGLLDIVWGSQAGAGPEHVRFYCNAAPPPPPPLITITTNSLPPAAMELNYLFQLSATGGTGPYLWTLLSGSLPLGLQLQTNGQLVSNHSCVATYNVTLGVTDSLGATGTKPLVLTLSCIP